MPKFFIAIMTIIENIYMNVFTSHKETWQDSRHREAREERAYKKKERNESEKAKELAEKQAQKEAFELRNLEWHYVTKIMEHFFTLKGRLPIKPLNQHFYRVEIIPLRTFYNKCTFVYAYITCKDCKGATVLVFDPEKEEGHQYMALSILNGEYVKIDKPGKDTKVSVLARAENIFKPIREHLAAA